MSTVSGADATTVSTGESIAIEARLSALNLSGEVFGKNEMQCLQSRVEDLRKEELVLEEHIALLKKEKRHLEEIDIKMEEIRKREMDIAEQEHHLHLVKSQMESENSDKEFELNQKQRELQHLEDQLHIKSKELKQKEYDYADGPPDRSSSQLAEIADRQYELDRRDKELTFKEENLRQWSINLQQKETEYKQRLENLQHREASLYSQSPVTQYPNMPSPSERQYTSQVRAQGLYNQQQPNFPQHQQSPNSPHGGHHHLGAYMRQSPDASPAGFTYVQQGDFSQDEHLYQTQDRAPDHPVEQPAAPPYERKAVVSSPEKKPANVPPGEPKSTGRMQLHRSSDEQLAEDLALARLLMEEEEKSIKTAIYTDEMLALTLQQEEMDSGALAQSSQLSDDGGAATIIKKELDERLTEEQRKKKQEEEDYQMAQRLRDVPADNSN